MPRKWNDRKESIWFTLARADQQFKAILGTFLEIQWSGLCAFSAEGPDSIPGQGTKILQAPQCGQKERKKRKENYPLLRAVGRQAGTRVCIMFYKEDYFSSWAKQRGRLVAEVSWPDWNRRPHIPADSSHSLTLGWREEIKPNVGL